MAQQASSNFVETLFEDSTDRVRSALDQVNGEWEKLQKQYGKRRKTFEKDAQRRVKRIRNEVEKNPIVKRAVKAQKDAQQQIDDFRADTTKLGQILRGYRVECFGGHGKPQVRQI